MRAGTTTGGRSLRAAVESCATETVTLHFTVADTGTGVPADKQHSIFNPSSQANGASTRRHGGTGLGLSISSQLAELMSGDIWLENRQGLGSIFHVTAAFGLQTDFTDTLRPIREALASLRGQRILVVDAHETTRVILHDFLTAWGLEPTAASSDASALAELRAAFESHIPYRFIIIDTAIPAGGGMALCDDLVQTPPLVDRIIVMRHISGRVSAVDRRHPQIAAYCTKPLTRTRLLDAITSAAGLARVVPGARTTARPAADDAGPVRTLRVLVAEDTATHRTLVENILTTRGHIVAGVSNGREVLAVLARQSFDVILMDLQMPVMDGFECTHAIRTAEAQDTVGIRIVAMTAAALKGDRERCLEAGMDEYVTKPIDSAALLAAIEAGSAPGSAADPRLMAFDRTAFLARLGGDLALAREITRLFLSEAPPLVMRLRSAIDTGEPKAIATTAHTLKGLLGNFAAHDAYSAALRLEAIGLEENLESAPAACASLVDAVNQLSPALEALILDNDMGTSQRLH